jgi:protein tyrosine phosphatase (PTP) superfamily phosphohydrolase (DUF442 family)
MLDRIHIKTFGVALLIAACSTSRPAPPPRPVTVPAPAPDLEKGTEYDGIHNVVAFSPGLYSGSAPEGKGLETLADMGIRTIISVDGAQPDVEDAEALGIRYVHLPISYDGITPERKLELARVMKDLPGPIYVHCHHGKHRSAGAAAAIAVALGRLTNDEAVARMKVAGTAPNYEGLYACATDTKVATNAEIASASNAFPSRWKTTGLVQAMVDIDFAMDNLKAIEKAKWGVPADHPDLVPAAEVGRISHLMRDLQDDAAVRKETEEFRALLLASKDAAESLEKGFLESASHEELAARFKTLNQSCKDCHVKFRD